jgi:hypothetical protein
MGAKFGLTLREEHKLRVSENRVLRKIFGPRDEDGPCRKLRNDELHKLYSSPNIVRVIKSRKMRWAGHVARMGWREVFKSLSLGVSKGRDRHKDLSVGGRITFGANWIHLAQDIVQWLAFVSTVMNLRVP